MVFDIQPSSLFTYFMLGVAGLIVAGVVFRQGDWRLKIITVAVVATAIGIVSHLYYRPRSVTVGEESVVIDAGGRIEVSWSDVNAAIAVRDYPATEYATRAKVEGSVIGTFRVGIFRLANNETARVAAVQNQTALILKTDEETYLLAPEQIELLIAAVSAYVPVSQTGGGR